MPVNRTSVERAASQPEWMVVFPISAVRGAMKETLDLRDKTAMSNSDHFAHAHELLCECECDYLLSAHLIVSCP